MKDAVGLDDVYRKFGEAAEMAQILETEPCNLLFESHCETERLFESQNPLRAAEILASVDRQTLGQLLKNLNNHTRSLDEIEALLSNALKARNRLFHTFYPKHNFRRNSNAGRAVMMQDLDGIHSALMDAYKAILALSGIDLDQLTLTTLPTRHLPI